MPRNMITADLKDECILGTDFLTPNRCVVDLRNNMLTIRNEQVPLLKPRQMSTPTCSRVTLYSSMDLPPMSEAVASAQET